MSLVTLSSASFFVMDAVTGVPVAGALCQLNSRRGFDGEGAGALTNASGAAVVEGFFSAVVYAVSKPGFIKVIGSPTGQINVSLQPTTVIFSVNIVAGVNGRVDPSGFFSVQANEEVTVRAFPDFGFILDKWVVNAVSKGNTNPKTFTVDRNGTTIAATFKLAEVQPPPGNGNGNGVAWPVTRRIHVFDSVALKAQLFELGKKKSRDITKVDTKVLLGGKLDYTVTYTKGTPLGEIANIFFNDELIINESLNKGQSKTGSIDLTGFIGNTNKVTIGFESFIGFSSEIIFDVWFTLGYSEEPAVDPGADKPGFFDNLTTTDKLILAGVGIAGVLLLSRGGPRITILQPKSS